MSASTDPSGPPRAKSYRGLTAEQRAHDRRARLVAAGLDRFAADGYAATTIQDVCRAAGVTARHFYEAFAGREELLRAVYDQVVADHLTVLRDALTTAPTDPEGRVRAAVRAALGAWLDDPRRARIAFVEVVGVAGVEGHRIATLQGYAEVVAAELAEIAPPGRDLTWVAEALVGAVSQILVASIFREDRPPVERLVDELVPLFLAGARGSA